MNMPPTHSLAFGNGCCCSPNNEDIYLSKQFCFERQKTYIPKLNSLMHRDVSHVKEPNSLTSQMKK